MRAHGHCLAARDGEPLQFDYGHLTERGSLEIGRLLARNSALSPQT